MKLFTHPFVLLIIVLLCVMWSFLKLEAKSFDFDFSVNTEGWQGDFTDYPVEQEVFFELAWGWKNLPSELFMNKRHCTKGIFLSGNNHSDDLFMFIKRQISGLKPGTNYDLIFEVLIQANIPSETFGIGGSPGENVYFKVGASERKPCKININGEYQLNVDKGEQSNGGKNAIVVGNLANSAVDQNNPTYEPIYYTHIIPVTAQTDNKGRLWVFIGTDSGFEGLTLYYIAHISIKAKESSHYFLLSEDHQR